ncbi:hypothetical protein [Marivirga sp.]|uniref:hypothetical protein n=1 Tax=Marivirga sp. TaxID=2018662 RepID=UPI0025FE0AA9|nr:hypothetical protein [Marivirga sp.]
MKKTILSSFTIIIVLILVACKENTISPMQKIEVEVGEAFIVDGQTQLNFANFDEVDVKIEIIDFSDHLVRGLVSPRTYVNIDLIDEIRTDYQVEAGYKDRCITQSTGGNCNELRFEIKDQVYFLTFEEVYWSEVKENNDGIEFIEVDSAQLIVERQ